MKGRLAAAVAAAALPLAVMAVPAAAEAADVTKVGWWSRNPVATAPEGGMAVSVAPDGPVSMGAVEIVVSAKLQKAVLILGEAGGGGQQLAAVRVCPTPNAWVAGKGAWADAPKPECGVAHADAQRNATLGVWSADVLPLLEGADGPVSLMVVPAGSSPAAWELRLGPPTLQVEPAPSDDPPPPPPTSGPTASSSSGGSAGQGSGSSFDGGHGGGGSAAAGYFPPPTATDESSTATAEASLAEGVAEEAAPSGDSDPAAVEDAVAGAFEFAVPRRSLAASSGGDGPSGGEALALVLIAAAAASGAAVVRTRLRPSA